MQIDANGWACCRRKSTLNSQSPPIVILPVLLIVVLVVCLFVLNFRSIVDVSYAVQTAEDLHEVWILLCLFEIYFYLLKTKSIGRVDYDRCAIGSRYWRRGRSRWWSRWQGLFFVIIVIISYSFIHKTQTYQAKKSKSNTGAAATKGKKAAATDDDDADKVEFVCAPFYPSQRAESWWLLIGDR